MTFENFKRIVDECKGKCFQLALGGRGDVDQHENFKEILQYCRENNIETVNVNQGYTRCSALVVNDKAVITADKSIEKGMKNNGVEVLLISAGNIVLEGFDYGFIGGASFSDNNTIYFFGDITKHLDYYKIKEFTSKHNSIIEILCKTQPLTDIGGAVLI